MHPCHGLTPVSVHLSHVYGLQIKWKMLGAFDWRVNLDVFFFVKESWVTYDHRYFLGMRQSTLVSSNRWSGAIFSFF